MDTGVRAYLPVGPCERSGGVVQVWGGGGSWGPVLLGGVDEGLAGIPGADGQVEDGEEDVEVTLGFGDDLARGACVRLNVVSSRECS
jgi:hypothetical protein